MQAVRPTTRPKVIAYLLYGNERQYERELAFSVLTALRFLRDDPRDVSLYVLTDRPALRFELGVPKLHIQPAELAQWTHGGSCPHRAKPLALRRALDELDADVALVDTDTCFVDHPSKVFERVGAAASVMHAYEYALGESRLWSPLLAALGKREVIAGYPVDADSPMFNSGVIGLGREDRALLDDAAQLLDALDALVPIFNAEQFAIGTVLNCRTRLGTVEHVVHHYWGVERTFVHLQIERLLRGFHPDRVAELARAAATIPVGLPSRRFSHRLRSRLKAQLHGWDPDCRFGYLAFLSARDTARTDRDVANAWLATALDALAISSRERKTAAHGGRALHRAFRRLDPRAEPWVEPPLAQRWCEFWAA